MPRNHTKAFTVIELLVVIGIVLVLLSFALPALRGTRNRARATISMSNIRQLGAMVLQYAGENKDLPPVLFEPYYSTHLLHPPQVVRRGAWHVRGHWFNDAVYYHYAFDPIPPDRVLRDPRAPKDERPSNIGPSTDYILANCLYASPEFWNRLTQQGERQFGAQKLSDILFPSEKGFMSQAKVYHIPGRPEGWGSIGFSGVTSDILWADHSVTHEVQVDLLPGEPNFWHPGNYFPPAFWASGVPIHSTKDGVRGRDRVIR